MPSSLPPFSGGPVANPITLPTDPTLPLQAATRQYIDNAMAYSGVWNSLSPIDVYVDPTAGSDTNAGTTPGAPKKTLAAVTQAPGLTIGIKRGSVSRISPYTIAQPNMSVVAYGPTSLGLPLLLLSTAITGTWVNVSGNIWSIAQASAPSTITLLTLPITYAPEGFTKLWGWATTQTAPAAGQFGWASGTLYIYSTVNPNTLSVEYGTGSSIGLQFTALNCLAQNIAVWCNNDDGIYFGSGSTGSTLRGCDSSANAGDGIGGNQVTGVMVEYCTSSYNGTAVRNGTGADGDGISFHGNGSTTYSAVTIRYCTFKNNRKSGLGNQSSCIVVAYGNYIEGCYWSIAIFTSTYTGGTPMTHTYYNNICVVVQSLTSASAFVVSSPPAHTLALTGWNNTLYATSIVVGVWGCSITSAPNIALDFRNNIVVGFDRGIDVRSGSSLVCDGNCLFGNTTNYFDNSTNWLIGHTGSHAITSNPLFADTANYNLRLASGSPCLGAGAPVGLLTDLRGAPIANLAAPQIGALAPN